MTSYVAENIRFLRYYLGFLHKGQPLSREELAILLDVSEHAIKSWELDINQPNQEHLQRLVDVCVGRFGLDISIKQITDEKLATALTPKMQKLTNIIDIIQNFSEIHQAFYDFAEAMSFGVCIVINDELVYANSFFSNQLNIDSLPTHLSRFVYKDDMHIYIKEKANRVSGKSKVADYLIRLVDQKFNTTSYWRVISTSIQYKGRLAFLGFLFPKNVLKITSSIINIVMQRIKDSNNLLKSDLEKTIPYQLMVIEPCKDKIDIDAYIVFSTEVTKTALNIKDNSTLKDIFDKDKDWLTEKLSYCIAEQPNITAEEFFNFPNYPYLLCTIPFSTYCYIIRND
jgi:transcriptional regulator with XRE-family HTH domain